jgi:hypothetical protein
VNGDGRKMIVADAHKDGVRLIVHAECLETALLELWTDAQRVAGGTGRAARGRIIEPRHGPADAGAGWQEQGQSQSR